MEQCAAMEMAARTCTSMKTRLPSLLCVFSQALVTLQRCAGVITCLSRIGMLFVSVDELGLVAGCI